MTPRGAATTVSGVPAARALPGPSAPHASIVLDPDLATSNTWGVTSLPATFLVKAGGEAAAMAIGARECNGAEKRALKTAWSDGTSHLVFAPLDLLARLAAFVPRPPVNLILYPGYLPHTPGCAPRW